MISNLLAIAILALWFIIELGIQWNKKYNAVVNLAFGIMIFLLLGVIYWAPFWLFFMTG